MIFILWVKCKKIQKFFCFFLQLEDKEEEKMELEKRLQGLNSDGEERQLS